MPTNSSVLKKRLLILILGFSVLIISLLLPRVQASYDKHHIYEGNFSNGVNSVPHYEDPSVSMYGLSDAVSNAIDKWNNTSNNVDITSSTNSNCNNCIVSYAGENVLTPPNVMASCGYFRRNILLQWVSIHWEDVRDGTNFTRARLRYDIGNMNDFDWTPANRYKTVGHEFGHALSLGHFEDTPAAHTGNHWMRSGKISITSPSTTDINHLREKWGN